MRNSTQFVFTSFATFCALIVLSTGHSIFAQSATDHLKFPYQALVLHDDAAVHSGPGEVHYATQKLKQGEAVEVYRHDPGGWCAIRPTNASFSLIPESTLELIDEGVGRISEDGTQAWVGTETGPVEKPLWQVKLQRGELVEVLGQVSWPDPEGHSVIWYQVSPPAGEFRWIRMSDIQLPAASATHTAQPIASSTVRSLNEILATSPALESGAINIGGNYSVDNPVQQATLQTEQNYSGASPNDTENMNLGWRVASRPIRKTKPGNDEAFGESPGGSTNVFRDQSGLSNSSPPTTYRFANSNVSSPNLAMEMNAARSGAAGFGIGNPSGQTLSANMSELELQLTREMLKEPVDWQLEDLEFAANSMRATGDFSQRMLAERYLTKISNCKVVRAGYQSDANSPAANPQRNSAEAIGTGVKADIELGTTYDAHGWLTQLVRDGGTSQPAYALKKENGKITHHVLPGPGLNIHRYLKSRVGITGKRGYHSGLKLDHVTAHQIVELEKPAPLFSR